MLDTALNPYQVPIDRNLSQPPRRSLRARFFIAGATIGVSIPLVNLILVVARLWALPTPPAGSAYSATPAVIAFFLVIFGSPILAVIFGLVGTLTAAAITAIMKNKSTNTV